VKHISTVIFLCLLFAFTVQASERYYFSNLSLQDGLSQVTITCIYQDSRGFMWFGTRNGLNRYDGYDFEKYTFRAGDATTISDNHILCLTEDNAGNLWIGTNNGLNKLDLATNRVSQYFSERNNNRSLSNDMVLSLCFDASQNLWIGTNNGLNLYNARSDSFQRIELNGVLKNNQIFGLKFNNGKLHIGTYEKGLIGYDTKSGTFSMLNNTPVHIRCEFFDSHGNLWIGTQDGGVYFLEKGKSDFVIYNKDNGLTDNYVRSIIESPDRKNILIGTFNGLNVIDFQTRAVTQYRDYGSGGGTLSHYSILSLLFDRANTLWVGTYAGGIDYQSIYGGRFGFYSPAEALKSVTGIIGPVVETAENLYIATEGSGLLEMNKSNAQYRVYKLFEDKNGAYASNILKSLYLDGNKILCGTNIGTIYSFDLTTKRYALFYDFKSQNGIYQIAKNASGDIIVAGVNQVGFSVISGGRATNIFRLSDGSEISFPNIRRALEIERGIYLIGSRNDGLYCFDSNTGKVEQFLSDKKENSLPENYITTIFKDKKNNIWIGTFGGGFCHFDFKTKKFTTYNVSNGLLDNNICTILEDNSHHLWISSISGITDFDISQKTLKNYSYSSGIKVNEFTLHAGLKLSDNRMIFSGNNGFLAFSPEKILYNVVVPPVVLENLYVNNEKVKVGSKILAKSLDKQTEIVLKYNESNFSIEYSALNYIFSNKNEYEYKLEGFDTEWNKVGNRRIAYYTNIPSGKYKFIVKGSNNDGVWNLAGTSILISVKPPLWKTWWAYMLYILFIAGVAAFVFQYFSEKKRLENDIKLRQAEAKAQAEFLEERNRLFANFSHELRTPLTLIISPLNDFVEKQELLPPTLENKIQLMHSNAQRMLRLVNNLMDFQKNESGLLKMNVSKGDFVEFADEMLVQFRELAQSRNIKFIFKHLDNKIDYIFDKNLMEKVFFNFLSNAFKNTPNGGTVDVDLKTVSFEVLKKIVPPKYEDFTDENIQYIEFQILNTGVGIAQTELEKIFIPFYQVAQNEHSASGTGLGLSFSKSIIELHHGIVWAESKVGENACFKCILPIDADIYSENDFAENNTMILQNIELQDAQDIEVENNKAKNHTILVVEDNTDLRSYIISHLKEEYNIKQAANGAEAIDKAILYLPDLIISDIMMPKMDGMKMAALLKNDLRTGHIPIVMITAKAMPEDVERGYDTGADDYITKPFNSAVLVARVRNLIKQREKLKEIYGKRFSLESLGVETTSADDRFLQKLYATIEKHLANPELNLDSFSQEIAMSKANLYRKIKALTNLSPTEFIRNFRLETAAKIMKETKMPVSEVFVTVGFNSHAYFSNCFRALYEISPTEYMNQL
jgi:signal transduction histidine kinase/ligand-binding sensor domain-containing protein/DNA-binding response OmpR family regulator